MVPVVAEPSGSDQHSDVESGSVSSSHRSVSSSRRRPPPPSDIYSPERLLRRRMIAITIVFFGGLRTLLRIRNNLMYFCVNK